MKTQSLVISTVLVGLAFFIQPASAQFSLVDDLTAQPAGSLNGDTAAGGGTWQNLGTADVAVGTPGNINASGNAAVAGANDGASYLALPTAIPTTGAASITTIFFQFDLGSTLTGNNVNWSVENIGSATDAGGTSAQNVIELNANQANRSGLTIRNGGAFDEMSADGSTVFTPSINTVYDMWFVINNSAQTYQIYLAGGALGSSATLMDIATGSYNANPTFSGNTAGAFRNPVGGGAAINDFVFGAGGTGDAGSQDLYNIYEDATSGSADLLNPVSAPEPGAFSFLALGFSAIALFRRLRDARLNAQKISPQVCSNMA